MLDFLSTTDVGRWAPNLAADEDARSEASEWELRERREREEERRVEAEELGAGGGCEEQPLFLRTPSLMVPRRRGVGAVRVPFFCLFFSVISFVISFVFSLVRSLSSWDRPGRWVNGELATGRHRADSGRETDKKRTLPYIHSLRKLYASRL